MALAMLVGNANRLTVSLFSPANTLAALLANNFPEAGPKEIPVLMYAALVLLAITLVVNIIGALVLEKAAGKSGGEDEQRQYLIRTGIHPGSMRTRPNPFAGVDFGELELSLYRPRTLFSVLLSWARGLHDVSRFDPAVRRVVDADLAWRAEAQSGTVHPAAAGPARTRRRIWQCHRGHADHGWARSVDQRADWHSHRGIPGAGEREQVGWGCPIRRQGARPAFHPSWRASSPTARWCLRPAAYSAIAGAIALSILMLPTIILTSESAIAMVPAKMKEAAIGMGATSAQTVWMVLLPTAMPGILTGVMLAVARAAGETAPLLFTALFSNYWLLSSGRGRSDAAHRVAGRADLQLLRHAVREPGRTGVGGRVGPCCYGFDR